MPIRQFRRLPEMPDRVRSPAGHFLDLAGMPRRCLDDLSFHLALCDRIRRFGLQPARRRCLDIGAVAIP
jgi:hypothetical protein